MLTKPAFILITIAAIFAGIYFWLATPIETNTGLEPRFDWPDETANYFWSKHYAQTGGLAIFEPLNLVAKNQIHPRSFNVRPDGSLVPGSFLGLILLYGSLAKMFSAKAIIYFTPILAIFGVLAFYGIIRRIFNEKIALLSAILMLIHPAWWYYSVTSMLPNVPFVSFLLLSIYFLFKGNKLSLSQTLISGLFAGLAISIRPAEIIWVGVVYLVVLIYFKDKIKFKRLILFFVTVLVLVFPSFYQQQILYGSFLSSGYNQLDVDSAFSCSTCQIVQSLILPFGFHPYLVTLNFWTHYLSRFWWLSLLAVLGLVAFLSQKGKQKIEIFVYILLSFFIFIWLGIYYGSWQFDDQLTVHLNTLGLSYIRYWLPLYILALPFIAIGLMWLTNFFKRRLQNLFLVILLSFLFYQSANLVLLAKPDSILPVRNRIAGYKEVAATVIKEAEDGSVIVTVRKDKVFFPERKVIHTFEALSLNPELVDILPKLVKITPVYYYALGPEPSLELENGLSLELINNFGQEVLYRIRNYESRIKNQGI